MSLVRWFRKNKTKIMAIVVIVILFGFIGGSTLLQQLGQRRTGLRKTIAYFGDNRKITNYDLILARQELGILRMLGVNDMLKNIVLQEFRTKDLQALLLGELLFSNRRTSPELIQYIRQVTIVNKYRISNKQINDIYTESIPSDICWLLLKKEAQEAGVRISNEDSGKLLAKTILQLFRGATYSQVIGQMVNGTRNQPGIPENKILATFGKLVAVLEYAKIACSSENITTAQIMHNVSWEDETIDVEFVKFDSAVFAETSDEPTQQEISEHFSKYKKLFAGTVSEENPYGFGYKLPDRVKLEYITVKLDDVSSIVTPPTQEETEEYYQRYRGQFTEQVPSEANDPNSPLTERIRSYAEMASIISKQLLQNKINSKSEQILQEARTLTEAGLEDMVIEPAQLSAEQYRKAAMAIDYEATAEQLSKKHKIKVYAGQTGMLNTNDIQTDEYLGRLYLRSYGYNLVALPKIVFAIDELGTSELGPFDAAKPRMYKNIGPLKDISGIRLAEDMSGQIMAVIRVIEAQKASEPESINQTFSKETLILEQEEAQTTENIYSVKDRVAEDLKRLAAMDTTKTKAEEFIEQEEAQTTENIYSVKDRVAEDLKRLAAMDTTKTKAEEFIEQAAKDGWESAIERFNELYGQQDKQDESEPNVFELQKPTGLSRISTEAIETLAVQSAGSPASQLSLNSFKKEALLREKLYSLVPQDSNSVDNAPPMEFKPNMSYYCLKNISVRRLNRDEYEKIKVIQVYKEDFIQSQSLAAVHFSPENILKRVNFRAAEQEKEMIDADAPVE